MSWHDILPPLLTRGAFATQGEICAALEAEGHTVTQGTLSRALRELGVTKIDGVYRVPAVDGAGPPLLDHALTAGDCLAVLKTLPAHAQVLARQIDAAQSPGVLGTVAGDDTVFVALDGARGAGALRRLLGLRPAR